MDLRFRDLVADSLNSKYHSRSQFGGRLAESWASENAYCLNCGHIRLDQLAPNTPVHDYECSRCSAQYQLKAKRGSIGNVIRNSSYQVKIDSIRSGKNPSYLFLRYDLDRLMVRDLVAVPRHFVTPAIIRKYPPLRASARRAGWVGSALLLGSLPPEARIHVVRDYSETPKSQVLGTWSRFANLATKPVDTRGWITEVLACVRRIQSQGEIEFHNDDIYQFESELSSRYPANVNIRPKIRQKLQDLVRLGVVARIEAGRYRIVG